MIIEICPRDIKEAYHPAYGESLEPWGFGFCEGMSTLWRSPEYVDLHSC